ncbi:mitochondrial 54S ribosomal protein uL16m [Kockiozyma suomiensis]|uniref:mitochondrial 54S ribosomal protein uL16m n=1 Tax=Kockiozyma suomiensis TaxID=1337062 RepID=UPI0033443362
MESMRTLFGTVRRTVLGLPSSSRVAGQFSQVRFHQYDPQRVKVRKQHKGRVPVRIGGSMKGTTLEFGNYGLRLISDGVRISAKQMKEAENVMMRIVRPLAGVHIFPRLTTNVAVCTKGNETRMGKGKGPFDYWAVRVATGKILLELTGEIHEQVAKEAFRLAAQKLPGNYEVISKDTNFPMMGFTKAEKPVVENIFEKLEREPSRDYMIKKKAKNANFASYRM